MNIKTFLTTVLIAVLLLGCGKEHDQPAQAEEKSTQVAAEDVSPATTADVNPQADGEGTPLEGLFSYMADAPQFKDCRTGKTFPVAMAGPYIELENAYLKSGIIPGESIKVSLEGRFLERPDPDGKGNIIMLIVDSFITLMDSTDCTPTADAELVNTYWRLVEVNGSAVELQQVEPETQREPHMVLSIEDSRVHGFAGCNNFFGKYQLENDSLTFSALGSTMMACPQGMDTEQAFLNALGETTRAEVSGLFLDLYAGNSKTARFEAVYLP